MREIGYKNPAWAIAELIDNSFQAGADTVDIRMKDVDWKVERSKPSQVAIVDNGIGMLSRMISHAVRWGGTDRENDRQGFGRYGYGLPSAAVSLAKRYSVYSKTEGKKWYVVHVDLEALGSAAGDEDAIDEILQPELAELPAWLKAAGSKLDVNTLKSGTIVVLEDLDRLGTMGGWASPERYGGRRSRARSDARRPSSPFFGTHCRMVARCNFATAPTGLPTMSARGCQARCSPANMRWSASSPMALRPPHLTSCRCGSPGSFAPNRSAPRIF
ncbi:ATP-binding protein [uncultured Sphingomonas sp.]|uniref:ATP-binding protein n=1 Tax=uncultured Sphingomonas sp. TaxID=158754 RepID=UPI0035CC0E72